MQVDAYAFWLRAPGCGVFRGGLPPHQHNAVRVPYQAGEFASPVAHAGALGDAGQELDGLVVALHESQIDSARYGRPL